VRRWLSKIDSLFVFLCLSFLTLFSFVNDFNYFFPKASAVGFKDYIDYKNVYGFPDQGLISEHNKLTNYNTSYDLLYSTNGGDSYQIYKNENIGELKTKDLTNKITSIRHKKPFGYMPSVTSILVKAKHKESNRFTKTKQITYFNKLNSDLPIVNLVVKESDLFDEYDGIMTLGEQSWFDNGFYKEAWYRNANYNQRGDDWLKEVYFQYFEENELQYETVAGIQISGHASRSFSQKSLKIKSTLQNSKLDFPFFGEEGLKKYSAVVLRNSGNDNTKSLFADLLMHNLIKESYVLSQSGRAVNVFLNGSYWGIYNLRERHNSYYIAKNENVKKSEVTVLEKGNGRLKSGDSLVQQEFQVFMDSLCMLNPVELGTYNYAKDVISIKSFIDYILIETFYGNSDWLFNNTLWYKAKDKKWKWLIVDLDNGLAYQGSQNINVNYFELLKKSSSITSELFNILIQNQKFKKKFIKRAESLMTDMFSDQNISLEYNKLKNNLNPNIELQLNRWRGIQSKQKWEQNCMNNIEFLKNRKSIFLIHISEL